MNNIFILSNRERKLLQLKHILVRNNYNVSFIKEFDNEQSDMTDLYIIDTKSKELIANGKIYEFQNIPNILYLFESKYEIKESILEKAIILSFPLKVKSILKIIENTYKHIKKLMRQDFNFIGSSKFANNLREKINLVADTNASVLITGESGTGKEIVANLIYLNSSRLKNRFLRINCSAIPENLLESELFGYKKGAFTGAEQDFEGKLQNASGGTIFMDEIGELPTQLQAKLLRVLEEKVVIPLGSNEHIPVDIRFIFATNKDIVKEVENKQFRKDLLYRINTIEINLSPLRERKEDIPLLINHFIKRYKKKYDKNIKYINIEDLNNLYNYTWPGNVRELEHFVERLVIYSNEHGYPSVMKMLNDLNSSEIEKYYEGNNSDYKSALLEFESYLINSYLIKNNWNIKQTAVDMGIERTNLYKKMKKFGIK